MLDPFRDPFGSAPVPAAVPLPRLRPARVGPLADAAAADGRPRVVATGSPAPTDDPALLSVTPIAPTGAASDPYADVPRIQPRTGFRRTLYDAASGLSSGNMMSDPISGFADSYLGSANAETAQTAAERARQIEEINRQVELENSRRDFTEKKRMDDSTINANDALADWRRANGGKAAASELTYEQYQRLMITQRNALNDQYGITGRGGNPLYGDELTKAQADVNAAMKEYEKELLPRVKGSKAAASPDDGADTGDGLTPTGVMDMRKKPGAADATETPDDTESPGVPDAGAYPDNISGTGTQNDPYRVKNARDPTLKAKIKVGDYFYTGKTLPNGKPEIGRRTR